MQNIQERVRQYIREHGLLQPGDRVLVALSGGADSVCLLALLRELPAAVRPPVQIRALHVHHGLRGAEADRDEAFVRGLCGRLEVPLTVEHYEVAAYAAEHGLSTEEAGRHLRYEALERAGRSWEAEEAGAGQVKIALAHHRDDNAETILHHLLRGSGLRGLGGIRPAQGRRIRPLLCVGRGDIESYLRERGLSWCEDSTNASDAYTRNRIRHHLLPAMAAEVNANAAENIIHAGEIVAQADDYLSGVARGILETAGVRENGAVGVRLDAFLAQPQVIRTYLLRGLLDMAALPQKDITARHYAQAATLAQKPVGSRCDLPGGLVAERGYEILWLRRGTESTAGEPPVMKVEMRIFSRYENANFPKNQYTKWFDYDKIKGTLCVRVRQSGDYLSLPGGRHKLLNRYFIDEKIPRERRDEIRLLAEGHHILWVVGYRISEYYKITEATQTILEARAYGGEEDGR